ncbi:hypothetical protein ACA910_005239 [Epithemia clementina (nom. ined.)]
MVVSTPVTNHAASMANKPYDEGEMEKKKVEKEDERILPKSTVASFRRKKFAIAGSLHSSSSSVGPAHHVADDLAATTSTLSRESEAAQSLSAMAMDEVSSLLREQDADLLERHESQLPNDATPKLDAEPIDAIHLPEFMLPPSISSPNASPKRPTGSRSSSISNTTSDFAGSLVSLSLGNHRRDHSQLILPWSPSTLPGVDNNNINDSLHFASDAAEVRSSTTPTTACTENNSTALESDHNSWQTCSEEPAAAATSSADQQQQQLQQKPTLGGQVFCEQGNYFAHEEDLQLQHQQHMFLSSSCSFPATDRELQNMLLSSSSHGMNNSDSSTMVDRRMSEAAQFAEAIGDSKVAAKLLILEEDRSDDDDDDDDDNVVHHQHTAQTIDPVASSNQNDEGHAESNLVSILSFEAAEKSGATNGVRSRTSSDSQVAQLSPYPKGRGVLRPSRFFQGHHRKRLTTKRGFLDQLPAGQNSGQSDYVYKGLHANPPEVVKRGTQRGNYAQLHRKAWLEVSDKYHRYGKNLRFYYRHWESLGCPTNMFFDWLDSKGEAAGQPLPEIQECPRAQLDADTVLYITDPEVTENYALSFLPDENGRGRVVDIDRDPVITGPDGWIFVLRDNRIYGAQKITSVTGHQTKERFHHSSFFGGKAVAAAGIFITDEHGFLTRLYPHSGHYRPGESHMQRVLFFLHHEGVDLRTFDMDMQQILHVAREKDIPSLKSMADNNDDAPVNKTGQSNLPESEVGEDTNNNNNNNNNLVVKGEKKKKVESLYLTPAVLVACFLAHKARLIGTGFFEQIHQIRKSNVTTVREALALIGDRGLW